MAHRNSASKAEDEPVVAFPVVLSAAIQITALSLTLKAARPLDRVAYGHHTSRLTLTAQVPDVRPAGQGDISG
ncbi:hypothetical protein K523DRAFT_319329 [Schizophyllum commune Tattone D]|nr:hypothetical protein K523DRAFT_319329 [Schizophyllum commune Tattone D]